MDIISLIGGVMKYFGDASQNMIASILIIISLSFCLYKLVETVLCRLSSIINENTASNVKISDAMQKISESSDRICSALNNVDKSIMENRIVLESCKKN